MYQLQYVTTIVSSLWSPKVMRLLRFSQNKVTYGFLFSEAIPHTGELYIPRPTPDIENYYKPIKSNRERACRVVR